MMTGTGASALADAVRLTRAAIDLRFSAALIIPPFYYRDATDEGIVRFFDALFERVAPTERSVVLYNFPRMSGITFHPDLVDRLIREFPGIICGIKDSSNTLDLEREIHRRRPDLAVFPGSEILLADAPCSSLRSPKSRVPVAPRRAWRNRPQARAPKASPDAFPEACVCGRSSQRACGETVTRKRLHVSSSFANY